MQFTKSRGIASIVAVIELLGGAYVLGMSLWGFTAIARTGEPHAILPTLAFGALGLLSIVAGLRLLRDTPGGWRLSMIVQAVQIPVVVTTLVQYSTFLLGRIVVEWVNGSMQFTAEYGGELTFAGDSASAGGADQRIGANLLALVLAVMLWHIRSRPVGVDGSAGS